MPYGVITSFQGKHRFLSNFWMADVEFEGETYPGTEYAYQAAKTLDPKARLNINLAPSPKAAKDLGRALKSLRPDWDRVKDEVMYQVVKDKFSRHADLRQKLLDTGEAHLVEGNWWHDNYWGCCYCEKCAQEGVVGLNKLGLTLMRVRDEIRAWKEAGESALATMAEADARRREAAEEDARQALPLEDLE